MLKHEKMKRIFVFLMVLCMSVTYMPSFAFATSEVPEDPISTEITVKGDTDGNSISIVEDKEEKKISEKTTVEGDALTFKYEVSEQSELQIELTSADIESTKALKKVEDNIYKADAQEGTFELKASDNAKMTATFTDAEPSKDTESAKEETVTKESSEEAKDTEEKKADESTDGQKESVSQDDAVKEDGAQTDKTEEVDTNAINQDATDDSVPFISKMLKAAPLLKANTPSTPTPGSLTIGSKLDFTHKGYPKETFHVGNFVGKCCVSGKNAKKSGKAKVQYRIDNNSSAAKLAYYYTYVECILNDKSKPSGKAYEHITTSKAATFGRAIGYVDMGATAWRKSLKENTGYGSTTIDTIEDTVKGMIKKTKDVVVPAEFEMYRMDVSDSSYQDFMIWNYNNTPVADTPDVQVLKQPSLAGNDYLAIAPANYTLQGATYGIYTDAACTEANRATDADGNLITLTTGIDGYTNPVEVNPGTYYAKELTASKGFKIDQNVNFGMPIVIPEGTTGGVFTFTSVENPVYGLPHFTFKKISEQGNRGWEKMLGAQYELSYYAVDPNTTDVSGLTPKYSWVYETKEKVGDGTNGTVEGEKYAGIDFATDTPIKGGKLYQENGQGALPLGVFTFKEIKAPKGFSRNKEVGYGKIYQVGDEAKVSYKNNDNVMTMRPLVETDQFAVVQVDKMDKETGKALPQGAARAITKGSLAGAEYDVYFDSPLEEKPIKVGTIVTDENGHGELKVREDTNKELSLGHYQVVETKASPGYLKDGEEHKLVARTQEIDSDFVYVVAESREPVHHTHISKQDLTTGKELPGAKLQVLNSAGEIVEEWISTTEPHDIVALHDETQGLKDGKYTLREITAPFGYDTAEDVEFTVKSGEVENTVEMKNAPINISTTATDADTKTHTGTFSKEEKIIDSVQFENLYAGREYTFKGVLMDKATEKPLLDKDGKEVTAERTCKFDENGKILEGEYTGAKGVLISGSVELEFTVDASEFTKDRETVAFEDLEREGRKIAMHADLKDKSQTVKHGGIVRTVAVDKNSKSHNVLADKNAVIVDTVEYQNLVEGETYTIDGVIFDKTANALTKITGSTTFEAKTENGTVEVEFKFDASEMKNHDLVVFETLKSNGVEVDKHEEPDDEDQTVHVPEIKTTATDIETNDHIAYGDENVQIKDVVVYTNLIPGKEYEMSGTLMSKQTGEPIVSNGNKVTATTKFTPTAKDGSVELIFTFDGVDLRGETVVAFEECKINNVPVAVHADINDKDQSVNIPKIGTEANLSKSDKMVEDLVTYENLKPGKYVMRGWLVDKKNEKVLKDSEGEIEFEVPESGPFSGDVTVELPIEHYGKLGGHKVVAFEELYYQVPGTNGEVSKEVLVCDHKDIDDDDQTVKIPGGPKTGDDTTLFLFGGIFLASACIYLFRRKKVADK